MNINDPRYNRFHLIKEMYETVDYINNFNNSHTIELLSMVPPGIPLMLTGEGSSRIYPAKNTIHRRLSQSAGHLIFTESSTDLQGKDLEGFAVIGASNSGKTKELINLFKTLKESGHNHLYGLSCNADSMLEKFSKKTWVIDPGQEKAVAATKSVVAQAMFYDAALSVWQEVQEVDNSSLAEIFKQTLNLSVSADIISVLCNAEVVYFSGYNNGVAEELTLKTNEIIRKKSSYLPGTYLLHGVEEVISPNDAIVMVDAYPDEFEKIKKVYTENIGTPVISISSFQTPFSTMIIPGVRDDHEPYIKLAAGWNLLAEAGIELGIDLDKPSRARKIGNEAAG
jgi:glutamine---fructose-6-phosphate transaminase (isomerizing)